MNADPLWSAEQALKRGDVAQARQLARSSRRPEAQQFLAMVALRSGETDAAVKHLERYLEVRAGDPNAWFNLGLVESQRGNGEAAGHAWQQALAQQPAHVAARISLGQLLTQQGQLDEGLEHLKEGYRQSPNQEGVTEALCATLLAAGRADAVLEAARPVLAAHPDRLGLQVQLGQALVLKGDFEAALTAFSHAAGNGRASPVLSAVQSLIDAGQPGWALTFLDRFPGPPPPHLLDARAAALKATGDREGAITLAREALAAAPDSQRIRLNLASLLSGHTDPERVAEAAGLATEVLEADPRNASAAHCLALVYRRQGALPAALDLARRALTLRPTPAHWLTLGDTLALTEPRAAVAELRAAAGRYPASAEIHRQLGIACLRADDAAGALAALDHSLKLDPGDQRSIAHRAVAAAVSQSRSEADAWLGLERHVYTETLPVPPSFASLTAFNEALAQDIAGHSRMRWEPLGLAARNGGLTDDLTADRTPAIAGFEVGLRHAIEALRQRLTPNLDDPFLRAIPGPDYQLNIWATYVRDGGLIDTHIHEESWLSGAYYVQVPPGTGDDGAIEFGRPHADLPQVEQTSVRVEHPQPGQLLLFPGYLFHRTIPHRGEQPRISISFDVTPSPA
ncbi:MAG: tetratricopeptide repeat protein [Pseudomonadota bacterium]